jgi:type II secretory pathway pseudopilin PulG
MNNRRGFTLIELIFSLFMMVLVVAGIYSLMITVYRVTRRQTEMANVQGNLRAGMQLVQSELQEIYTDAALGESDIVDVTPATEITYEAMRGVGETCGITAGGGAIKIRQSTYSGREPARVRDRLLLFQDRDTLIATDDTWLLRDITEVAEGTCTVGPATASWDLTVPALLGTDLVGGGNPLVFAPGPVRTIERMQMGLVTDGGSDWLGIRSVNNVDEPNLIPVIGPLAPGGLDFSYENGDTDPTSDLVQVKTILVKLWGISARTVTTGLGSALGNPRDSIVVRVQLRNSR